jgi:integrase
MAAMDLTRMPNGKWKLRWREGNRRRARTFNLKKDAITFETARLRRKQLGYAHVPDDVSMREFIKTYWRLHAKANLAESTQTYYLWALDKHIEPRLGDHTVRELTPKRLARFREDLERAGQRPASVRKIMAIVQSILSLAVSEELVEFNAAATVRKPSYKRARAPHIFLPPAVESIRGRLGLRDRTLVSVLAYSGPRPEEVVCRLAWADVGERTIHYVDAKRGRERHTPLLKPLADDLREWFFASGRPSSGPVFPAHDGDFWDRDDWGNFRNNVWKDRPERKYARTTIKAHKGCAPAGTRPRDLRSSFITVQIYAGVPLTTICKWVGTSVVMIENHYSGVIADWDGRQIPAEQQILAARMPGIPGRMNGST